MVVLNRVAVVLALVGVVLFGLREGTKEAINGHPEALWHDGVRQVDEMITDGTERQISNTVDDSVSVVKVVGSEVGNVGPE
jgi:hypothetical protein